MKILVVDDHPITRVGIRTVLELQEGVEQVGDADNAEEAFRLARDAPPDLVILDLRLKGDDNGIELCREIKSLPAPPAVLIYTAHNSAEEVSSALLAGADGYVHKGVDYTRLSEAIERTCAGDRVWLLGEDRETTESLLRSAIDDSGLTPREKEVFALVHSRHTNKEISEKLYISLQTTKNHVSSILRKLNRRKRSDLY
jgi:DNA-binding NarL/FixJ family response regulator